MYRCKVTGASPTRLTAERVGGYTHMYVYRALHMCLQCVCVCVCECVLSIVSVRLCWIQAPSQDQPAGHGSGENTNTQKHKVYVLLAGGSFAEGMARLRGRYAEGRFD